MRQICLTSMSVKGTDVYADRTSTLFWGQMIWNCAVVTEKQLWYSDACAALKKLYSEMSSDVPRILRDSFAERRKALAALSDADVGEILVFRTFPHLQEMRYVSMYNQSVKTSTFTLFTSINVFVQSVLVYFVVHWSFCGWNNWGALTVHCVQCMCILSVFTLFLWSAVRFHYYVPFTFELSTNANTRFLSCF